MGKISNEVLMGMIRDNLSLDNEALAKKLVKGLKIKKKELNIKNKFIKFDNSSYISDPSDINNILIDYVKGLLTKKKVSAIDGNKINELISATYINILYDVTITKNSILIEKNEN